MARVELAILGLFRLRVDREEVTRFRSHNIPTMLAWLALEGKGMHPRSTLAGVFWPEHTAERSRQNLRQTLLHLRRTLAEECVPGILQVSARAIGIQHGVALRVDALEFLDRLEVVRRHNHSRGRLCRTCTTSLEAAVALYRGPLLQALEPVDNEELRSWMHGWRTRFQHAVVNALQQLGHYFLYLGHTDEAQRCARRRIELDPFDEGAIGDLVRALEAAGRSLEARSELDAWRARYVEEFGEEPDPSLLRLAEELGPGRGGARTQPARLEPAGYRLPAYLTPFFGRAAELEWCAARLLEPTARLLTLCGPGGCGKTRLAVEFARRYGHDLEEPAIFVRLAGVGTAEAIPAAIADHLGWRLRGSADPVELLAERLGSPSRLVILDGIEPLLPGAAGVLVRLLRSAPQLVLIVTSRERIHLQAEHVLRVSGLDWTAPSGQLEGDTSPAIALFQERASRVRPDLAFDAAWLPAITRICEILDGMPLSLELAAGLIESLTPPDIAAMLERCLDGLETRFEDIPAGHRSLRTVFERSFERLLPERRRILVALSPFRGDFDEASACAVTGATAADLIALRDRSMIQRTEPGRHKVFEVTRRFAEEMGGSSREELEAAYGCYYAGVARECLERRVAGDEVDPCATIALEWPNMRAALQWGMREGRFSILEPLLEALRLHHDRAGSIDVGIALLGDVRGALQSRGDDETVLTLKARTARELAVLNLHRGNAQSARRQLEEALTLYRRLGAPDRVAETLALLGGLALRWDAQESERWFTQSIEAFEPLSSPGVPPPRLGLATAAAAVGQYERAFRLFRHVLEHLTSPGAERQRVDAQVAHARARLAQGDPELTIELARRSLEDATRLDTRPGQAAASTVLAEGLLEEGRLREARRQALIAHELCLDLAHADLLCDTLRVQGLIALERGDTGAADRHLVASIRIASEAANPGAGTRALLALSRLMVGQGLLEDAARALRWIVVAPAAWHATRQQAGAMLVEIGSSASPAPVEAQPVERLLDGFHEVLTGLGLLATAHDRSRSDHGA